MSFYSFLEQFFYNNGRLKINQFLSDVYNSQLNTGICNHSINQAKIVFSIGILRIEFKYVPVDIYELDLVCFRDVETLNKEK
jgi:hypothetical protein